MSVDSYDVLTRAGVQLSSSRWTASMAWTAPGHVIGMQWPDRLRVVVVETTRHAPSRISRTQDVDQVVRCHVRRYGTEGSVREAADKLFGDGTSSAFVAGAVADLFDDGHLEIDVRNGPPAVVVGPSSAARILGPTTGNSVVRLDDDEVIILTSAGFLEDPPSELASLREGPPGTVGLERLRDRLAQKPVSGASAMFLPRSFRPLDTWVQDGGMRAGR